MPPKKVTSKAPAPTAVAAKEEVKAQDLIVRVGTKEVSRYVQAISHAAASAKNGSEIHVVGRGKAISRAVDAAEIYTNKQDPMNSRISKISSKTETIKINDNGTTKNWRFSVTI